MMTDSKAKGPNPLSGVIQRNDHALGDIRQQTRRLNQLTAQLGRSLPARLQGQWQVAALSPEALVIAVNGSVWSTTLRARHNVCSRLLREWKTQDLPPHSPDWRRGAGAKGIKRPGVAGRRLLGPLKRR
jgi:hypothetical protein